MKFMLKTSLVSVISLTTFITLSFHTNKFILSILKFTYPTIFQGWQTFVAVILVRLVMFDRLVPFRWKSFAAHCPLFLCYVVSIIAGSKALSVLPIPIVIAVINLIPASNHIVRSYHLETKDYMSMFICSLCVCSVVFIFCLDPILSENKISTVWTLVHVMFSGLQSFLEQASSSSTFSSLDKLFYSNLFSVIVLAPCSFYLQEAFEVLHFQERRQLSFLVGCVCSGVFGIILSILKIYTDTDQVNAEALSRALCCFISPFIIPCVMSTTVWILVIINVIISCCIPLNKCALLHTFKSTKLKESQLV